MAPLSARTCFAVSSVLANLDCGVAQGYSDVPLVEHAIAVHLCPQNAATWRNRPRLPSKACKFTSFVMARAASQTASALHEGSPDLEVMQELRSATDYALRATKVMAQALCWAISTLVAQEYQLWLKFAEMRRKYTFSMPQSPRGAFSTTLSAFPLSRTAVRSPQQRRKVSK